MTNRGEHISGVTTHKRRGAVTHGFRYRVDFVLIDPDAVPDGPVFFSRNRFNVTAVHDRDHGGPLKNGAGVSWARNVFAENGLDRPDLQILLLAQPRVFGFVFNPVSFWLAMDGTDVAAVIAEVSTPFGDRHSYLCHQPEFAPITKESRINKPKTLHVSPFQDVAGDYTFTFDIQPDHIAITIHYRNADDGVVATLSGPRRPMTNLGLLGASLRRPFGGLRTLLLIHWQALKLAVKRARFRSAPDAPLEEVSR